MNVLKVGGNVTIIFDDGNVFTISDCPEELFFDLIGNEYTLEEVIEKATPGYSDTIALKRYINEESQWLQIKGNSVIMPSVSEISIPDDFVEKFVEAERSANADLIQTYTNFWTLVSLNPDSRVRNNIFWFIRKWDMKISKSGLIIAYRNADVKSEGETFDTELTQFITSERDRIKHVSKKSPANYNVCYGGVDWEGKTQNFYIAKDTLPCDHIIGNLESLYNKLMEAKANEVTTFTDHHSHTFDIRIGQVVKMPREHTDSCQDHTCSSGLHVASKGWLKHNYFGSVGLKVLVNPAHIVAVPPQDSYGKMRTCEYLPIGTISFDENGDVIDDISTEGFEDEYFDHICYDGEINNEDYDKYTLEIPDLLEVDRATAWENLRKIAKECKKNNTPDLFSHML